MGKRRQRRTARTCYRLAMLFALLPLAWAATPFVITRVPSDLDADVFMGRVCGSEEPVPAHGIAFEADCVDLGLVTLSGVRVRARLTAAEQRAWDLKRAYDFGVLGTLEAGAPKPVSPAVHTALGAYGPDVVDESERGFVDQNGAGLGWGFTQEGLWVQVRAPTAGWVALGFGDGLGFRSVVIRPSADGPTGEGCVSLPPSPCGAQEPLTVRIVPGRGGAGRRTP